MEWMIPMEPYLTAPLPGYEWQLSLVTLALILGVGWAFKRLLPMFSPTIRAAVAENKAVFAGKMAKPNYAANQAWNRKWGAGFMAVIFGAIMPFCVTLTAQPLWAMLLDMFVILMVYDFFYYFAHRFLFHDEGFFGGPLKWVHGVHHRQHNPCRQDSSYIHPIEVAIGLGLYVGTILLLSRFMGEFHVATIVVTWIAFSEINLHNHDRWTERSFPFAYIDKMAFMHHNHHAKFTGGNFATISLLYDWLLGTLDDGEQRYGLFKPRKTETAKA